MKHIIRLMIILILLPFLILEMSTLFVASGLAAFNEGEISELIETEYEAQTPFEEDEETENDDITDEILITSIEEIDNNITDEPEEIDNNITGEPEETEEQEPELEQEPLLAIPFSDMLLSEYEMVVYSFDDLKTALESASIIAVYLGENIIMETGGIIINPAKASLVIDGINPLDSSGIIHTITDYNSSTWGQNITMRSDYGPKSITLRNLYIYGKNYYGTVGIPDTVTNVTMTYENVEYYGPQLVYNARGTAHFKNAFIQIGKFEGTSAANEAGEVGNVIFEGKVDIYQEAGNINSVFWFRLQSGKIEVKSEAAINITTSNDHGFAYVSSPYKVAFIAQSSSEFYYSATKHFWYIADSFSDFTVENNAKVHISITTGSRLNAVLRMTGNLYVGQGAELHLIGSSAGYPTLVMNGGSATFENPGSVLLYSPSNRTVRYETAANMTIHAQQLNYWTAAGPGGFDDPPLYTWRKADESLFTLNGTVSAGISGNFSYIDSNYSEYDISAAEAPNSNNFSMVNARVIAFGQLDINADYEYLSQSSARIVGFTKPYSNIILSYSDQLGNETAHSLTADGTGGFVVNLPAPLQDGTAITILGSYQYLLTKKIVYAAERSLQFELIPDSLHFPSISLAAKTQTIGRSDPNWNIVVYNSNGTGSAWTLTAKLLSELASHEANLPVLTGALVFINKDGDSLTLDTNTEVLITSHTSDKDVDITPVTWDADKGILLTVEPGTAYADVPYTATIAWTLINGP